MAARAKMLGFVNWRMRVQITDTREILGTFLAFDKHMNIVLGDSEEFRLVKNPEKGGKDTFVEEKRPLGLVLLRGEAVVSIKPVSPPAPKPKYKAPPGGAQGQAALPTPGGPAMPPTPQPGMPPMGMPIHPGMPPMMGMQRPPMMFGRGMPPMGMPPMGMPGMMPGGMPGMPPGGPPPGGPPGGPPPGPPPDGKPPGGPPQ